MKTKCTMLWRRRALSGENSALENKRHFVTPPTVFPRNDDWVTTEEIPYWLRFTTQIWVVRQIGWNKFLFLFLVCVEFQQTLLRCHLIGRVAKYRLFFSG